MSILKGAVLVQKEPDHNELRGVLRSLGGHSRKSKGIRDPLDILGFGSFSYGFIKDSIYRN